MKKAAILLAGTFILTAGCSESTDYPDEKVRSVTTELTQQNGLKHWKISLTPNSDSFDHQGYELELWNAGDATVKNVTVYLRVDTKEKLSAPIVKADSKTVISKLDPNETITLSELTLPMDTPISVGVDWLEGSYISKGAATFRITEYK